MNIYCLIWVLNDAEKIWKDYYNEMLKLNEVFFYYYNLLI